MDRVIRATRSLGLSALLATLLAGGVATAATWVVLGDRVVNDRTETDTIAVTGVEGTFTALKVKVLRRRVHFIEMTVHFGNGDKQEVELRKVIPAGGESRVIDLEGGRRIISKVVFRYEAETAGRARRAAIRLLGRR